MEAPFENKNTLRWTMRGIGTPSKAQKSWTLRPEVFSFLISDPTHPLYFNLEKYGAIKVLGENLPEEVEKSMAFSYESRSLMQCVREFNQTIHWEAQNLLFRKIRLRRICISADYEKAELARLVNHLYSHKRFLIILNLLSPKDFSIAYHLIKEIVDSPRDQLKIDFVNISYN